MQLTRKLIMSLSLLTALIQILLPQLIECNHVSKDSLISSQTLPTPQQLEYQRGQVSMFLHFSMCTFANCEQDTQCRTNPPSLFNPTNVNVSQWMETARALGATEACLTSHHTGGFALFQTNYTQYGIKESPYRGGEGDIVKEFVDAARAAGISPCLYFINAWDCYESGDAPDDYLDRQLGMLTQLMTQYGPIYRFWFDQFGFSSRAGESPAGLFPAAWANVSDHVRRISPSTLMLPGPDGCLNPGEGGGGVYPVINYVDDTTLCSYPRSSANMPNPNGTHYVPYESDLSIQNPGDAWFWHAGHPFDSGAQLFEKYLATAGRGSHFILNMPPNTTGVIPEEFVTAARGMGNAVRASFAPETARGAPDIAPRPTPTTATSKITSSTTITTANYASTSPCNTFSLVAKATAPFDAVLLEEDLTQGQKFLNFTLEMQTADNNNGAWNLYTMDPNSGGATIGSRLIVQLPTLSQALAVRVNCTGAIGGSTASVRLSRFSLHKIVSVTPQNATLRSYIDQALKDTAPCALRDGGTCATYTNAGYKLVRSEALVLSSRRNGDPETRWVDLAYSLPANDNGLSGVMNDTSSGKLDPRFAPAGYKDEGSYERAAVFTQPGTGRVALDAYYSAADLDFWVLASAESRTEALQRGYKLVGTVGYGYALSSE